MVEELSAAERQERITFLNTLATRASSPAPTFEQEMQEAIGQQWSDFVGGDGDVFRVWEAADDINKYPKGFYIVQVDSNGRMVKRVNVPFNRLETWEYDEEGYTVEHSARTITKDPRGWTRKFIYRTKEDGSRELQQLVYQEYKVPEDVDTSPLRAQHDDLLLMAIDLDLEGSLHEAALSLTRAVEDLIPEGEESVIIFENGKTDQPAFIGRTTF